MQTLASTHAPRIDWVDYAKGLCIIMVVMLHSTLGVEKEVGHEGWMHYFVIFAHPFRMPDFFMISGLFLAKVIDRDWRTYADKRVVHFAYFYVVWLTLQIGLKAPGIAMDQGIGEVVRLYLISFIDPFGSLWFIYLLPIFFIFTKATRRIHPAIMFAFGAAMEIAHVHTGWTAVDEFAARFVYFYTGYMLANHIFSIAGTVQQSPKKGMLILAGWAIANSYMVFSGNDTLPFVSLALGMLGAFAVVRISTLLSMLHRWDWLRYCGEHSLFIYLAFFLPMAATRAVLLKTGVITDIGTISLIVTVVSVIGALAMFWLLRNSPLWFLYKRPERFHLHPNRPATLQPAE